MSGWSPVLIQTVISIAVMVAVGLAVLGQVRWRATQEWEALAVVRQERITALEKDLQSMEAQVKVLKGQIEGLVASTGNQIRELQQLNLELQRQLDQERRRDPLPARGSTDA